MDMALWSRSRDTDSHSDTNGVIANGMVMDDCLLRPVHPVFCGVNSPCHEKENMANRVDGDPCFSALGGDAASYFSAAAYPGNDSSYI